MVEVHGNAFPTGALPCLGAVRERMLEAIAPTRCAGCERPGALICDECLEKMAVIDPRHSCTRCGAPFGDILCTECAALGSGAASRIPACRDGRCLAATVFTGPVPRIVRAYKDAGEQRLARPLAELMLDAAEHAEETAPERYGGLVTAADAIVFVPATAAAFATRGFDHMELVAAAFAQMADKPLVDALLKHGSSDQRALGREERRLHALGAYEVVEAVKGMRVLLLDDVITTGATMHAAGEAVLSSGAARVDALAFARVW